MASSQLIRRLLTGAAVFLALAVVAIGLLLNWSWQELNKPLAVPDDGLVFEVERGSSLIAVSRRLADAEVLEHPVLLNWYARLNDAATGIHAGEYRLEAGTTTLQLLDRLGEGDVLLHQVTLVEGWRAADAVQKLREHPAIQAGTESLDEIMQALGRADLHPEGQFLPDTYTFPRGTRDLAVLEWAHEALQETLDEAWAARGEETSLSDPYQGLILASIIEKETALDRERPLISGVFHARLQAGMRLQTDPTVIYGVGDSYQGDLTSAHLRTDTPYNTYTRHGLPPTPIALAGRASIVAALNPEPTDALYFVATGDADGSHTFSTNIDDHNRAVRRYLERTRGANQ